MSPQRLERLLFRALPATVLMVALIGIAVLAGTAWPWTRVVHEDGVHTLLGTLFYFEHATRELVPDLVLALGVAGAVRYFFPAASEHEPGPAAARRRGLMLVAGISLITVLAGTIAQAGWAAVADNLLQLHTRPGATLVWGAHWRYHLLERVAQILLAFALTGVLWMHAGRPDGGAGPERKWLFRATLALFAGVTLVFRPTLEPFREPTFLGHQARELFTHTLVTLPLALGICFSLARQFAPTRGIRSAQPVAPIVLAGGLSVAVGLFLLVGTVLSGARDQGQTSSLGGLLFPHFAEHAIGYVLVPVLAGVFYLWPGSRRQSGLTPADADTR